LLAPDKNFERLSRQNSNFLIIFGIIVCVKSNPQASIFISELFCILKMLFFTKRCLKEWSLTDVGFASNFLSSLAPCHRQWLLAPDKNFEQPSCQSLNF